MTNVFLKRNKYGSKRTRCLLGHNHPSRIEREYCECLQMLKKNGDIKEFEYEKKYELRVNGNLIGCHKPDFTVTRNDGKQEVHETKGFETMEWRLRRNLFEAIYPNIPYMVIK